MSKSQIERVERLLAACSPGRLGDDVALEHARRWRSTFADRVRTATGEETHLGFDWHAFSYPFVAALTGDAARAEYRRRERQQQFLVLVGPMMNHGFSCEAATLPWLDSERLDAYVIPANFSWTMVFTHEREFGPYFKPAEPRARR